MSNIARIIVLVFLTTLAGCALSPMAWQRMPTNLPIAPSVGTEGSRLAVDQQVGDCLSSRQSYLDFQQRITRRRNNSATASTVLTVSAASFGTVSAALATALATTSSSASSSDNNETLKWLTFGTTAVTAIVAIPAAIIEFVRSSQTPELTAAGAAVTSLDAALETANTRINEIERMQGGTDAQSTELFAVSRTLGRACQAATSGAPNIPVDVPRNPPPRLPITLTAH